MPKNKPLERAAGVLELALSRRPRTRERVDALIRQLEDARHDRRRVSEAGRALEAMRKGKSYKALGFETYAAFLASVGISRTTAYEWRMAARGSSSGGAESVKGENGRAVAGRIATEMATRGVEGRVFVIGRGKALVVRVELGLEGAKRMRFA
jgi:hypothetical protein